MRADLIAGLALATCVGTASACGVCIEDKIAAVYDHAIVTRALVHGHQVAFFALDGQFSGGKAEQRAIQQVAQGADGVDPGSTRVSVENASLSVAFDPARVPFAKLQRALEKRLSSKHLTLLPLRVMDQSAGLKTVNR
jgi:hypothetical protein